MERPAEALPTPTPEPPKRGASALLPSPPVLDDVVHVLVATPAEVDEHRARAHLSRGHERVRHRMRALEQGSTVPKWSRRMGAPLERVAHALVA